MHRRLAPLVMAAAAIPLLLVAARPAADGVTYSFTMTTVATDDRGRSRDVNSMSGKAHVTGEYARMDIQASKNQPMMERGSYLIMRADPATFFMVNPRKKEYVEFPVGEMARGMMGGAGGVGGMIRIAVTDASTSGEKAGSGGDVNGQQTELYRITQEYTMSVRVLGRRNTTTNKSVSEYYVAPQLRGLLNPLGSFAKGMSAMVATPGGGEGSGLQTIIDQAEVEQHRLFAEGTPVRIVTRTTATDDRGRSSETLSTMDLTDINRGDIAASVFALPPEFKRIALEIPDAPAAQEGQPEQRRGNPLRRAIPRPN